MPELELDPLSKVTFHVGIRVGVDELAHWTPERITAFFEGLAQVLSAGSAVEEYDTAAIKEPR